MFPQRCILHLDADAFFASVEQRDDPRLRDRPVAVGTGVVASCSYEARRHGVSTGMRLVEARYRCRDLIVVPGEYPRYEQAARHMLAICLEQTPLVEVAALDDMYLDLTRNDRPERAAVDLRSQVGDEVQLSISIGMGTNKLVAKVATKEAKQLRMQNGEWRMENGMARSSILHPRSSPLDPPSSIVLVPAGGERAYLAPWPVRVLPGAGRKIGARLERLNVQHVGEVAAMPLPLLTRLFRGSGRVLHEHANGIDLRPVQPHLPQQSISRSSSFDPPVADRDFLRAMIDYLMDRASSWLRFHRLAAGGLTVTVRYGDYEYAAGHESFRPPIAKDRELREAARDRFERLYRRRLPLRLVGIELSPLAPADPRPTLFADPDEERRRRLAQCTDEVRRRFGFTSLLSGTALELAGRLDRDRENFRMRTPCLTR
jgi:DNA polymerase-4